MFADPESGAVARPVVYASGLEAGDPVSAAGHVLDCGQQEIGGRRYLLPKSGSTCVRSGKREWREETEYVRYRKFETDATIRYKDEQ